MLRSGPRAASGPPSRAFPRPSGARWARAASGPSRSAISSACPRSSAIASSIVQPTRGWAPGALKRISSLRVGVPVIHVHVVRRLVDRARPHQVETESARCHRISRIPERDVLLNRERRHRHRPERSSTSRPSELISPVPKCPAHDAKHVLEPISWSSANRCRTRSARPVPDRVRCRTRVARW